MREVKNTAQNTKFIAVITELPSLVLTTQSINVPNVSVNAIDMFKNNPQKFLMGGNTIIYEPLILEFIISEDHSEWHEIYTWFTEIVKATDHTKIFRTAEIEVLDNQNQKIHSYKYDNCLATNLSGFRYITNEEQNIIVAEITLEFEAFSIILKDGTEISVNK